MSRSPGLMVLLVGWIAAALAQAGGTSTGSDLDQFDRKGDFSLIISHVVDQRTFYGLAHRE